MSGGNTVFVNLQGETAKVGQQAIWDVTFGSTVPEPTTIVLLATGVLGLLLCYKNERFIRKESSSTKTGSSI